MMKHILGALALLPVLCFATDFEPWYGDSVALDVKNSYFYQSFNHVDGHRCTRYRARDSFDTLSAEVNYDVYAAELEVTFADTKHRSFGFDNVRLTGRYQLMNDILADPYSIVAGLTLTQCCKLSLHDVSSFHHGLFESELHIAAGKETECEEFWVTRYWGVLGIGLADRGSAWVRLNAVWERNWWNHHQFRAYINTLWGFGGNSLNVHHFHGYGPIGHQSIDIGVRYDYLIDCFDTIFSLAYERRLYARNFPECTNVIMARLTYQFGVDVLAPVLFWKPGSGESDSAIPWCK